MTSRRFLYSKSWILKEGYIKKWNFFNVSDCSFNRGTKSKVIERFDYKRWARSWSRFLGSQPAGDINPVVGCRYFPSQRDHPIGRYQIILVFVHFYRSLASQTTRIISAVAELVVWWWYWVAMICWGEMHKEFYRELDFSHYRTSGKSARGTAVGLQGGHMERKQQVCRWLCLGRHQRTLWSFAVATQKTSWGPVNGRALCLHHY